MLTILVEWYLVRTPNTAKTNRKPLFGVLTKQKIYISTKIVSVPKNFKQKPKNWLFGS
jgi:hypothetical protein